MSTQLTYDACHPHQSVVIEACAGSGKTWLLVSRIVRLLLSGAQAHEILAITFTRKAAQEMRARLDEVLLHFAKCSESELLTELMARGLNQEEALDAIPKARRLFEQVLSNPRGLSIDTFHGWFARLLGAAPIGAGVPQGLQLRDDFKRLQDDCLEDWWTSLPHPDKSHLREAYELLVRELGASNANELLIGKKGFLTAKSEWVRYLEHCKKEKLNVLNAISDLSNFISIESPLKSALGSSTTLMNLMTLSDHLENGGITDKKNSKLIKDALALHSHGSDLDQIAHSLRPVFLTGEYQLLKNLSASGDLKKSLKNLPHPQEIESQIDQSRLSWAQVLLGHYQWAADHRANRIHQAWITVGIDILSHYQAQKELLRVQDFSDLEAHTAKMMLSSETAAYLQARLDAKYKHLLIDEFQDTNPLQWQILLSWLNAYSQDDQKPTVFLVGDPKQSIYRFRRADVRLFEQAKAYLKKHFHAVVHPFNETRRNSPAVLNAVNQTFGLEELPVNYPFQKQERNPQAANYYGEGEVYRLPLIPYPELETLPNRNALETPYIDINKEAKESQSYQEAILVGQLILKIKSEKDVGWNEFLILLRSRTPLPQIERAFRNLGIPCDSPRQGGLLKTLEAEDLIALLSVLLTPTDDLSLAQVLKSPLYGLNDVELMKLIQTKRHSHKSSLWHLISSRDSELNHISQQMTTWSELAKRLPVHDLLDHIYDSANLRVRYAQSAPPLQRDQVLSNLDAFLGLALDLDGGRYPSLTRFISELKKIKRGAEEESPDEGDFSEDDDPETSNSSSQRVRILTIHAAKGLEARYVMLMNANSARSNQDHVGVLMNWPPEEDAPNHISPFFSSKPKDLARQHLREQEEKIAEIENWNLLYVALTRAKESIYISGTQAKGAKPEAPASEGSWYARLLKANVPQLDLGQLFVTEFENTSPIGEINNLIEIEDFIVSWQGFNSSPKSSHKIFFDAEEQFLLDLGVAFHAVMEHVMRIPLKHIDQMPSAEELACWLNLSAPMAIKARQSALNILGSTHTGQFFFSPLIIASWEELDICDGNGRLLRIDRLIELPDQLIILDYKLSIPEPNTDAFRKYQTQMAVYRQAVNLLRPEKNVQSYLLSANGDVLEISE
ncbi:MAG: hypothetical protein RLZZ410_1174 [Pseudomonadota bacterium]|jgi:ATP-dependent helicase/nuclease subunit A